MKLILLLLAICLLFPSLAMAQYQPGIPSGSCGLMYAQPQRPVVKKYWNEAGLKKYSMDAKEAGKFRADLTAQALAALIGKYDTQAPMAYAYKQRIAAEAVIYADETLVQMGLITFEEVKPEQPAKPVVAQKGPK
jgi:hypothetical protein